MKTTNQTAFKGAEEARKQFPAIISAIITRHGREIAAVVPAYSAKPEIQPSLLPLAGSGRNFWGADSSLAINHLRGE
jgi:hypothetical protein